MVLRGSTLEKISDPQTRMAYFGTAIWSLVKIVRNGKSPEPIIFEHFPEVLKDIHHAVDDRKESLVYYKEKSRFLLTTVASWYL